MLANMRVELRKLLEFLHENEGQHDELHQWDTVYQSIASMFINYQMHYHDFK